MKNNIKYLIVVITLSISSLFGYSQNKCNADLQFLNNSSSKKAGESGTYYRMKLINKGESQIFNIIVENGNSIKQTSFGKGGSKLLELTSRITSDKKNKIKAKNSLGNRASTFSDKNKKSNEVSLERNEEFIFYVRLAVPKGTEFGSINKSIITITSGNCTDFKISKELTTEIIDGE